MAPTSVWSALAVAVLLTATLTSCSGSDPATSAGSSPAASSSVTVEYSPGLTEDIYLPADSKRVPLVVLIPGGGWMTADPAGLASLAAGLAEAGVAAAPAHIRASDDGVTYPAPVEDVLCAVAAATEHLRSAGYAPRPVVVLGHSSGAHLAALAVLAVDDYAPTCDSPEVRPDALVGLSGPYDISQVPDVAAALLGSSPDEDPGAWASANPVARAGLRPEVPVLLLHGDADELVPVDLTTQFAEALDAAGHRTTVEVVPGADHETIYSAEVAADRITRWLRSSGPWTSASRSATP
ncbi:prolyl oligopeptidase family serine peptidase [Nocardioides sp. MAH-18]|uniref:Prolyl oligopeptidase family serine peptidase n=1 Tax=Nocardioides agri TaxID=2682843 RepID=A0A6L6XNE3_9ACTN|nr:MULTISPECIES: alpha/beta hydrolase [unclassified Nocardioides]MBA2953237.1 alpha/beta hydrolase [Nocardioides sp. CGMCC 1.13656]MVQ48106.1 prolyl oligopeptidase family serine peptidase [Nocardioides sp. MAH-18]